MWVKTTLKSKLELLEGLMRKYQDDGIVWQLDSKFLPSFLVILPETMTECDVLFPFIDKILLLLFIFICYYYFIINYSYYCFIIIYSYFIIIYFCYFNNILFLFFDKISK